MTGWLGFALAAAILIGVAAGTALIVRNPAWWIGMARAIVAAAMPEILRLVTKRMTPEQEKAWRDCQRQAGRRWNPVKKRCE